MRSPSVVVFDLDGTLIDSAPTIGAVLDTMRAERGMAGLHADAYRGWVSRGAASLVGAALELPGPAAPDLVTDFRRRYANARTTAADLYAGVDAALATLQRAGIPMGVCSNKPNALCEKVLRESGIRDYFLTVVGGDAVAQCKPHPMHLTRTLASMQCEGQAFFFVGDSRIDAEAARAVDAVFLWAAYGYAESDELANGARRLASPADIAPAVLQQAIG